MPNAQVAVADLNAITRVLDAVRSGNVTPGQAATLVCNELLGATVAFSEVDRCRTATKAILAEVLAGDVSGPVGLLEALLDRRDQGVAGKAIGRLYLAMPQADRNRLASRSTFA